MDAVTEARAELLTLEPVPKGILDDKFVQLNDDLNKKMMEVIQENNDSA